MFKKKNHRCMCTFKGTHVELNTVIYTIPITASWGLQSSTCVSALTEIFNNSASEPNIYKWYTINLTETVKALFQNTPCISFSVFTHAPLFFPHTECHLCEVHLLVPCMYFACMPGYFYHKQFMVLLFLDVIILCAM